MNVKREITIHDVFFLEFFVCRVKFSIMKKSFLVIRNRCKIGNFSGIQRTPLFTRVTCIFSYSRIWVLILSYTWHKLNIIMLNSLMWIKNIQETTGHKCSNGNLIRLAAQSLLVKPSWQYYTVLENIWYKLLLLNENTKIPLLNKIKNRRRQLRFSDIMHENFFYRVGNFFTADILWSLRTWNLPHV